MAQRSESHVYTAAMRLHIIGASGRSGTVLCRSLLSHGIEPVPIVRSAARWAATGLPGAPKLADLTDATSLAAALQGAEKIVSCAHARHAPAILAAAPPGASFVFLGSTRKFTRWPDAHGNGVLAGETAFLASGRRGVMLHPTMIYGAQGEDNVQRLAALLRKLPVVPLPDGGGALVQPIHQDDVTASIRAALTIDWPGAETLTIAGPAPLTYADFVRAVASAVGLPPPKILAIPALPLRLAAPLTAALPFLPRIRADEIRRLTEDKAFPIEAMIARLGITPRPLAQGLATLNIRK
jgi:uncharacterized protein YbjT (DUF2867 family)